MQAGADAFIEDLDVTAQSALVLFDAAWHQGVVGHTRVARQGSSPPADDRVRTGGQSASCKARGARSRACTCATRSTSSSKRAPGLIVRFGGHAAAAGLTLRADGLAAFRDLFEAVVRETLDPAASRARIETDGALEVQHANLEVARLIEARGVGPGLPGAAFADDFAVEKQRVVGETPPEAAPRARRTPLRCHPVQACRAPAGAHPRRLPSGIDELERRAAVQLVARALGEPRRDRAFSRPTAWRAAGASSPASRIGLLVGVERERNPDREGRAAHLRTGRAARHAASVPSEQTGSALVARAGLALVTGLDDRRRVHRERAEATDPGTTTVGARSCVCYGLGAMIWSASADARRDARGGHHRAALFQAGTARPVAAPDAPGPVVCAAVGRAHLRRPAGAAGPATTAPTARSTRTRIWLMVVLISGIGLPGYIALRLVGGASWRTPARLLRRPRVQHRDHDGVLASWSRATLRAAGGLRHSGGEPGGDGPRDGGDGADRAAGAARRGDRARRGGGRGNARPGRLLVAPAARSAASCPCPRSPTRRRSAPR